MEKETNERGCEIIENREVNYIKKNLCLQQNNVSQLDNVGAVESFITDEVNYDIIKYSDSGENGNMCDEYFDYDPTCGRSFKNDENYNFLGDYLFGDMCKLCENKYLNRLFPVPGDDVDQCDEVIVCNKAAMDGNWKAMFAEVIASTGVAWNYFCLEMSLFLAVVRVSVMNSRVGSQCLFCRVVLIVIERHNGGKSYWLDTWKPLVKIKINY